MHTYGCGSDGKGIDENGDSMLAGPKGLSVTDEWVYIADTRNDRIVRFARNSRVCEIVYGGEYVPEPDPMVSSVVAASALKKPAHIVADELGFLIINAEHNRISRLENNSLRTFYPQRGGGFHRPEHIKYPRALRIFPNEGMLLVDTWSHRIIRLSDDPNVDLIVVAGVSNSFGKENTKLYFPSDVVVYNGDLIIADTQNNRLMRWKPGASEGTPIVGSRNFSTPVALALADNHLFVSERQVGRVVRVDLTSGDVQLVIQGLNRPCGIALHDGRLFVCDEWNNRVLEVDASCTVEEAQEDVEVSPRVLTTNTSNTCASENENTRKAGLAGLKFSPAPRVAR